MTTQLHLGDCLEVMRAMPDCSVDEWGGCCWELRSAADCLRDRSRLKLMRRWSVRQDGKGTGPAALAVEEAP